LLEVQFAGEVAVVGLEFVFTAKVMGPRMVDDPGTVVTTNSFRLLTTATDMEVDAVSKAGSELGETLTTVWPYDDGDDVVLATGLSWFFVSASQLSWCQLVVYGDAGGAAGDTGGQ